MILSYLNFVACIRYITDRFYKITIQTVFIDILFLLLFF